MTAGLPAASTASRAVSSELGHGALLDEGGSTDVSGEHRMTTPHAQPLSARGDRAAVGSVREPAPAAGPFVINLCSSTTPMALTQPAAAELRRFTFFVSRRLEDGRERFRLHMGYFETLQSAEEWLTIAREVYPGAWAGEAPGKRLAARAAAESAMRSPSPSAAPSRPSAPVPAIAASVPTAPKRSSASSPPTPALAKLVPTLQPAPEPSAAPPVTAATPPRRTAPPARSAAGSSAPTTAQGAQRAETRAAAPRAGVAPAAGRGAPPSPVRRGAPPPSGAKQAATRSAQLSNVSEVLAQLDETGATRQLPVAVAPRSAEPAKGEPPLSDSQVLRVLEERNIEAARAVELNGISLLKPDDTGTRQAIKQAVASNAPVSFAVQLQWSVQPIDANVVPPLAIFSAYTLYTVEGSRQGRRWFGLRLGFFGDAISAKQVAYYVRSEFTAVAVVPVSPQERERASAREKSAPTAKAAAARDQRQDKVALATSEFMLIDDSQKLAKPGAAPAAAPAASARAAKPPLAAEPQGSPGGESPKPSQPAVRRPQAGAVRASGSPPGKRAVVRPQPGRVGARERRSPRTLEETLEILGADQLEIDHGRNTAVKDRVGQLPKAEARKNSPFMKLLDRLADRVRGGD